MNHRSTRRSLVLSATALSAALAVGVPAIRHAAAEDANYPELTMIATDYAFEMATTAEGGFTRLTIDNQGSEDHHAIFFRLNDDVTMEQFQEVMQTGDLGAILGVSTALGGPNVGPGHTTSVIADLVPGQYVVVCVIPDPEGTPHAAHGMVAPLEVTDGGADTIAPEASASIALVEMAFNGLPEEVDAGRMTWEVTNLGAQLHELVVLQLADDVTSEMVMQMLTGAGDAATPDPEAEGPPFEPIAGTAPMSREVTNYLEMELEPGDYMAICFIPDVESGMPHFAMGMVADFTVS